MFLFKDYRVFTMPNVRIRDIAVIEDLDPTGHAPVGEGPKNGAATTQRLNIQERADMIQRQFESIAQLMKFAQSDHGANCIQEGTAEKDPDYITRISTAEFNFYTIEPLNLPEFEELIDRIATQAKYMDKGVHLVLGSFAVITSNQNVINVTPHITCGEPPSVTLLVKNLTTAIDVRYKEIDDSGIIRTLPVLDSTCFPSPPLSITIDGKKTDFQLNNIIHCKTPGETPFLTAVDICEDHTEAIAKRNAQQLVANDPHLGQQPFSHMVISNSVFLIPEHCIGTPMHVDPIGSTQSCKQGVKQEHKVTFKQSFAKAYMDAFTTEAKSCSSLLEHEDELKRQTQITLSSLREKAERHNNTLSSMGFGDSDESMQEFLVRIREEITKADSPLAVEGIIRAMKMIILSLEENQQMREIKKTIHELRNESGKPTLDAQEKATRIEAAAAKIPLEDRCSSLPIPLSTELVAALASSSIEGTTAQTAANFKAKFHQQLEEHRKPSQDDEKSSIEEPSNMGPK